jgi:hypothetical protein
MVNFSFSDANAKGQGGKIHKHKLLHFSLCKSRKERGINIANR